MAEMRVAVTGTRYARPTNGRERDIVFGALHEIPDGSILVTGGCVGIDAYASEVWHSWGGKVHVILPFNRSRVDPSWYRYATTYREMPQHKPTYRDRNLALLDEASILLVFPQYPEDDTRSRRSGTWQTCRLARRQGHIDVRVFPLSAPEESAS